MYFYVIVSRCETEVFLLLFFGQKSKQKGLRRSKSIGFYFETFATKTKLLLRRQTLVFVTLPYPIKARFTFH